MSYYKVGLDMDVRVVGPGRVSIGADQWGPSEYRAKAKEIWLSIRPASYAVIVLGANGEHQHVRKFETKANASIYYDGMPDKIGELWTWEYASYWDNIDTQINNPSLDAPGLLDEKYRSVVRVETIREVVKTTPRGPSNLALAFGVGATALAGFVAFGGKRRKV